MTPPSPKASAGSAWGLIDELWKFHELFSLQQADERTETLLGRLDRVAELCSQCLGDATRGSPPVHLAPAEASDFIELQAAYGQEMDQPVEGFAQTPGVGPRTDDDDATVFLLRLGRGDGREIEKVHVPSPAID